MVYKIYLYVELEKDDDVGEGDGEHCRQCVQLYAEESQTCHGTTTFQLNGHFIIPKDINLLLLLEPL